MTPEMIKQCLNPSCESSLITDGTTWWTSVLTRAAGDRISLISNPRVRRGNRANQRCHKRLNHTNTSSPADPSSAVTLNVPVRTGAVNQGTIKACWEQSSAPAGLTSRDKTETYSKDDESSPGIQTRTQQLFSTFGLNHRNILCLIQSACSVTRHSITH